MLLRVDFDAARFGACTLIEFGPGSEHRPYLHQVVKQGDRVHPYGVENLERLLEYRVGGHDGRKTVFGLIIQGENLGAVIHGIKDNKKIVDGQGLPGNVDCVLKKKANEKFEGPLESLTFFTVSSYVNGAGPLLVQTVNRKFPKAITRATLSPSRTTLINFPQFRNACLSDEERIVLTFVNLLPLKKDGTPRDLRTDIGAVQGMHMFTNGAHIAAIHCNANAEGTEDHRDGLNMMLNYIYVGRDECADGVKTIRAIHQGDLKLEHFIRLVQRPEAERVVGYMAEGVLKELYHPDLPKHMQDILYEDRAVVRSEHRPVMA